MNIPSLSFMPSKNKDSKPVEAVPLIMKTSKSINTIDKNRKKIDTIDNSMDSKDSKYSTDRIVSDITNKKQKKFDPRARLKEMRKMAEMKGGPVFAAKLRSNARKAMLATQNAFDKLKENNLNNQNNNDRNSNNMKSGSANNQNNNNNNSDKNGENENDDDASNSLPKISAVDLPGMSFITLFCDDQKVSHADFFSVCLSLYSSLYAPIFYSHYHLVSYLIENLIFVFFSYILGSAAVIDC